MAAPTWFRAFCCDSSTWGRGKMRFLSAKSILPGLNLLPSSFLASHHSLPESPAALCHLVPPWGASTLRRPPPTWTKCEFGSICQELKVTFPSCIFAIYFWAQVSSTSFSPFFTTAPLFFRGGSGLSINVFSNLFYCPQMCL